MECASAGSCLAESLVIAEEKKRIQQVVALAKTSQLGMPGMVNPEQSASFQPPKETKKVGVDPSNPERQVIIGSNLDSK